MHRYSLKSIPFLDRVRYLQDLCAGKRVLHLGATDSPVTKSAIENGRFLHTRLMETADEVVGMDLDAAMIAWLKDEHGITNILAGNIEVPSEYPQGPFDLVVAGEIFEHLNNPGAALAALRSVLGGTERLVISVPNAYSIKGVLRALGGHEWIHPDHVLHHSASTLNTLLRRHDFEPVEWFAYVNGGQGVAASVVNGIIRLFPRVAEGIGVVARPV